MPSDVQVFGKDDPLRTPTRGRPEVNRSLALRLLQAGIYTKTQIASALECDRKTVGRIEDEFLKSGDLVYDEKKAFLNEAEADFDDECKRATGMSFKEWLKTKTVKASAIFTFCRRTWMKVWGSPSLVLVRDYNNSIGDKICLQFTTFFAKDIKRIRRRKKYVRYLFRFLGRKDLCDRHLTMSDDRDPRSVRRLPEISFPSFVKGLVSCYNELDEFNPEMGLAMKFKTVSQARTGALNHMGREGDDRGLIGIRVGSEGTSYLFMESADKFSCSLLEKKREDWPINWIPEPIRKELFKLYKTREMGEPLFSFDIDDLRKKWKEITEKHLGKYYKLHDMRKVSVTWLYVMEVPLEIATVLNVGWKDMNTPRDHYLHYRKLLKASNRLAYRDVIPGWFKEGLGEYRREGLEANGKRRL